MLKLSSTPLPLSPEEHQEASQLFGRSLFSAIQLAKENALRARALSSRANESDDENVLKIPIPAHLMPQRKVAEDYSPDSGMLSRAFKMQSHPIQMLLGGQQGFGDAKKDFYMDEKARIQKDLMHAQKEYIDLLGRIKTGSDENTPCVDAFCNGVAHEAIFEKEASRADDTQIEEGSIRRLMGEVGGLAKKPFQPAIDTAASGLLGTGAGAAYLTYMLRKKMREQPDSYMQDTLPTRVELEPYA